MKVGIDAIAYHGPEHYIDLSDLAIARDVDPAKYIYGLGQKRMAIATPCEDTVTLAVNAGQKAIKNFNVDPSEIGTLVVGTETGIDHSKPVAVYVHEALGLRTNCRTYETKHACFGAMAGLTSACDWITSKRAQGSKALVIAADIARYPLGDPGEPTQGAGAVAMIVSESPRLFSFHPVVNGDFTKHVMDFWRPLYSKAAIVDGHYSIQCYLEALKGTVKDALEKTETPKFYSLENLDSCFYHTPFVKMAKKAHHRHWEIMFKRAIGHEDSENEIINESYQKKVLPWLTYNSLVGNIYTGSLFLSLMEYLSEKEESANSIISLFSYGSGCAASFQIAQPTPGFSQFKTQLKLKDELNARNRLTFQEYEKIIEFGAKTDINGNKLLDPSTWNLKGDVLFLGTQNNIRVYSGIS